MVDSLYCAGHKMVTITFVFALEGNVTLKELDSYAYYSKCVFCVSYVAIWLFVLHDGVFSCVALNQ